MKIYKRRREKLEEIDEMYQAFSNVTSEESGNVISDETPIWNDFKGEEVFLIDAGVFPG